MVFLHFLLFSLLCITGKNFLNVMFSHFTCYINNYPHFYSPVLCAAAKCEEALHFQTPSRDHLPPVAAVHVEPQHLKGISDSVLTAETWVKNHVLAHYPATNITTIVIGSTVLCDKQQQKSFGLILPSIKNIHHSLIRWGLHHEIKVSAVFSSDCLDPQSESYRADVAQTYIKPLLTFLQEVASPYLVKPPQGFLASSSEEILKSHRKSMKNLGVFGTGVMNIVIISNARRKMYSSIDISNSRVNPFPPRPTPAFPSGSPLPPLVGSLPPQPYSPPFLPHLAPTASPPMGPHLPPCEPSPVHRGHGHGHGHGSWCVAKPSVPAETLQEALDFACGEGNVDCEAIKQDGSCFYPDNLVAHASYAFNSYWQTTKRNGGTCGFAGTAMLISSDPSKFYFFLQI